jgi:outer membrane receptor for ferrienterochelin and colicins
MRKRLIGFFTLISLNTVAQNDSLKIKDIGEVVVTGQYRPQSAKNSVYQVRTIGKERIAQQGAVNLQTVLNNELNIRFSQDVATGGSDISMMGLRGQNVKILLDGLPLVGRQGASNEININQIDINSIERIEIVEGPMSVVFGADALAGVINIITKKASQAKLSVTARLHEESIGSEYGIRQGIHNMGAGLSWRNKHWEIGGNIGYNYFGGWRDTAVGRELVWHKKDQILANGYIGYRRGRFAIRYRIDGLDEIVTNPGNFQAFPDPISGAYLAYDQEYLTNRLMHQLQSSYTANGQLDFQLQSSYTDYSRQVFSTTVNQQTGKVNLDMGTGRQAMVAFKGFTLRSFANYRMSNKVALQPGIDINLDRGEGERLQAGNNSVNDFAFFITSEIKPNNKINIRPGLRIIKNSVYAAPPVVPSINAKVSLGQNWDVRAAYARGFRSPSLRELYFNFFDANHQILGNPDLKAETSNSFTASANWKKTGRNNTAYTFVLSGFYNSVDNMIDYAISPADPNIFVLTNVFNSKTAGANLAATAKLKRWNLSAGMGYTGFYNDFSSSDKSLPVMMWSPEMNAGLGYGFAKIGLDLNLFYKFTGKRPYYAYNSAQQLIQAQQKGWHMADLTVTKKAFKYLAFNGGVRNLFDVDRVGSTLASGGVHTAGGTRNIATGRSFFAGLVFNWEKK